MEQITAELRVTNLNVKPFGYDFVNEGSQEGESVELRASGHWSHARDSGEHDYFPVSLHFTVFPGHEVIPALGDCLTVTIARK